MTQNKTEQKLFKCAKCGKLVVADDYNFYFHICYTCEKDSGTW